jgi:hypothetical protein
MITPPILTKLRISITMDRTINILLQYLRALTLAKRTIIMAKEAIIMAKEAIIIHEDSIE